MKKLTSGLFTALILTCVLFAQVSVNPKHNFYSCVERWELMEVINEQPPMRPYPVQLVQSILEQVIEGNNEKESVLAEELYEEYFNRPYHLVVEGAGGAKIGSEENVKKVEGLVSADGDYKFSEYVGAGYELGVFGTIDPENKSLFKYQAQPYYMQDSVDIGPAEATIEMDVNFAAGKDTIYFQAGVNHSSFGPFYEEGSVLSPDAKHTSAFTFVYNPGRISYTQSLLGLSASNGVSEDLFPGKFLSIHSLNGQIFDWLTASFYEVTVYGGRFEPAYLIPAPYMVTQGLAGFDDNILMGVTFTVKPVKNLAWVNDFFIDDLGLNDIIRFNFDTKIRGTFQTGIKYLPPLEGFGPVKLGYTLVTPYMYTHMQNVFNNADGTYFKGSLAAINYQQYTTAGCPIGSTLPPNSDRLSLSATYSPVKNLNVTVKGSYIRHANVNENLPVEEQLGYLNAPEGYFATDGSINNHQHYFENGNPDTGSYLPSAWHHFLFMCQDTKMEVYHAGFDADYSLPKFKFGTVTLELSYLFEFIKNAGVDADIFRGHGYYSNGEYVAPCTNADVEAALAAWRANLTNQTNHYVTFSAKYVW